MERASQSAGVLEKVLVVDDDRETIMSIKAALQKEKVQCEVIEAWDGNQVIEMNHNYKPKVIVLDIMLPKRSGFLVLQTLKAGIGKDKPPYVIVITGMEGQRHRAYAENLGAVEYLKKPFEMEKLTDKISKYLSRE